MQRGGKLFLFRRNTEHSGTIGKLRVCVSWSRAFESVDNNRMGFAVLPVRGGLCCQGTHTHTHHLLVLVLMVGVSASFAGTPCSSSTSPLSLMTPIRGSSLPCIRPAHFPRAPKCTRAVSLLDCAITCLDLLSVVVSVVFLEKEKKKGEARHLMLETRF